MKNMIWPIMAVLILLGGCQSNEPKEKVVKQSVSEPKQTVENKAGSTTFPYPNLLATQGQTYSLLAIGEENEQSPIEKNTKIIESVKNILSLPTLELAQKAYPDLHISNKTAYIVFDQTGVIHQSKDINDLTSFLQSNPPK